MGRKEIPACVEWMLNNGVDPEHALEIERQIDPQKAKLIREERGKRQSRNRRGNKRK